MWRDALAAGGHGCASRGHRRAARVHRRLAAPRVHRRLRARVHGRPATCVPAGGQDTQHLSQAKQRQQGVAEGSSKQLQHLDMHACTMANVQKRLIGWLEMPADDYPLQACPLDVQLGVKSRGHKQRTRVRRRGGGVPGGGGRAAAGHAVLALQLEVAALDGDRLVLRLQLYAAVRLCCGCHPASVAPVMLVRMPAFQVAC